MLTLYLHYGFSSAPTRYCYVREKYQSKVAAQCPVLLCWWSYMIQQWQGSGVDGGSWHHINCTCSAGPPYWARGGRGGHANHPQEWLSNIPEEAKQKIDEVVFLIFCLCVSFPRASRFCIQFVEICVKQGIKCWEMISTVFFIGLYVFLLSSRYVSLFFIPSVFWENSVDKSVACQAWLRSIKEDIGRLEFQRAALTRKSLSVRMKSFKTERLPSIKLV